MKWVDRAPYTFHQGALIVLMKSIRLSHTFAKESDHHQLQEGALGSYTFAKENALVCNEVG